MIFSQFRNRLQEATQKIDELEEKLTEAQGMFERVRMENELLLDQDGSQEDIFLGNLSLPDLPFKF